MGTSLNPEGKIKLINAHFSRIFMPKQEILSEASETFLINPPRKTLLTYFLVLFGVIALTVFLSIGALAYMLILAWIYIGYCVYSYIKLCSLYGYSSVLISIAFLISLTIVIGMKLILAGG